MLQEPMVKKVEGQGKFNRRGSKNPNWKGGIKRRNDGYVLIYNPSHPHARYGNYVYEHRLIMEKHIKRFLDPKEVVHHINGDQSDNRIENLMLFKNNAEHLSVEMKGKMVGKNNPYWKGGKHNLKCKRCNKKFKSYINPTKPKYCSSKCYHKARLCS